MRLEHIYAVFPPVLLTWEPGLKSPPLFNTENSFSEAIRLAQPADSPDLHLYFSNRCAARLQLANLNGALEVCLPLPPAAPFCCILRCAGVPELLQSHLINSLGIRWAGITQIFLVIHCLFHITLLQDAKECTKLAPRFAKGWSRLGTCQLQLVSAAAYAPSLPPWHTIAWQQCWNRMWRECQNF